MYSSTVRHCEEATGRAAISSPIYPSTRSYIQTHTIPEKGEAAMATQKQITANRKNAKKSTGPKTPEGKAKSAQNAYKHGLTASPDVIRTEDPEQFNAHREMIKAAFQPRDCIEQILTKRVAVLSWRLDRTVRIHNQLMDCMLADHNFDPGAHLLDNTGPAWLYSKPYPSTQDPYLALGCAVRKDFNEQKALDRCLRYERRIENSFFKCLKELEKRKTRPPLGELHEPQQVKDRPLPVVPDADHYIPALHGSIPYDPAFSQPHDPLAPTPAPATPYHDSTPDAMSIIRANTAKAGLLYSEHLTRRRQANHPSLSCHLDRGSEPPHCHLDRSKRPPLRHLDRSKRPPLCHLDRRDDEVGPQRRDLAATKNNSAKRTQSCEREITATPCKKSTNSLSPRTSGAQNKPNQTHPNASEPTPNAPETNRRVTYRTTVRQY